MIRNTPQTPCPVCGGHDRKPRNKGARCYGFISEDSKYAFCTRDEHGRALDKNLSTGAYRHLIHGNCLCGITHSLSKLSGPDEVETDEKILENIYDYINEDSELKYQVLRYRNSDGSKTFRQRQSESLWSLKGVKRIPYRLPELLEAPLDEPVFIVEGEKDVDRLRSIGFTASCNSEGAGKFREDLGEYFANRKLVLIPDNDEAGKAHVEKIADILSGSSQSMKIVDLPDLQPKGDISDWLDMGNTAEGLSQIVEKTEEYNLKENLSSFLSPIDQGEEEESYEIRVWKSTDIPPASRDDTIGILGPIIPPSPALLLLVAETSSGKTVLCVNMAYCLAEGKEFLGYEGQKKYKVLYLDLESPANLIRNRLDTVGRSENLFIVEKLPQTLNEPDGLRAMENVCRNLDVDILLIDSLPQAWPVLDEDKNSPADAQMWRLKQLTQQLGIVCIALYNSGEGHNKEKFKARGATARVDRTDVTLFYKELSQDTRELKVVKSRYGTLNESVKLRFDTDLGFEVLEKGISLVPSQKDRCKQNILDMFVDGNEIIQRKDFVDKLGNENQVDKALRELRNSEVLVCPQRGSYQLVGSSSSSGTYTEGKEGKRNSISA